MDPPVTARINALAPGRYLKDVSAQAISRYLQTEFMTDSSTEKIETPIKEELLILRYLSSKRCTIIPGFTVNLASKDLQDHFDIFVARRPLPKFSYEERRARLELLTGPITACDAGIRLNPSLFERLLEWEHAFVHSYLPTVFPIVAVQDYWFNTMSAERIIGYLQELQHHGAVAWFYLRFGNPTRYAEVLQLFHLHTGTSITNVSCTDLLASFALPAVTATSVASPVDHNAQDPQLHAALLQSVLQQSAQLQNVSSLPTFGALPLAPPTPPPFSADATIPALQSALHDLRAQTHSGISLPLDESLDPSPTIHALTGDTSGGFRVHDRKLTGVEFLDDDKRKHVVFRPSLAYENAPKSNFVRRMSDPARLEKGMSGEGLLLDPTKFRSYLLSQAHRELFGIVQHDPVWASEYELSRVASLPILRSATEFEKLLQGKIDKLTSFLDSGSVSNLAQLERALKNIEHTFVAVFDRRWKGCNSVVLDFLQSTAIRIVPIGFPTTYIELALSTFNQLVTQKYTPNPASPSHPPDLASMPNVLCLWKALLDPVTTTCTDPTQLSVYYRLYGYDQSGGRASASSARNLLASWDSVTPSKGILKPSRAASDSESVDSTRSSTGGQRRKARKRRPQSPLKSTSPAPKKVDFASASSSDESVSTAPPRKKLSKRPQPSRPTQDRPPKQDRKRPAPRPSTDISVKSEPSGDYCMTTVFHLYDMGRPCPRGDACRYSHPASVATIDKAKLHREIQSSPVRMLTPERKSQLKRAMKSSSAESKDE